MVGASRVEWTDNHNLLLIKIDRAGAIASALLV